MSEKRLLTVDEVARFLRVAPNTVYRWCRDGKLTGIKIGKEWRIAQADLDHFLTARTGTTTLSSLESLLHRRLTPPEHILLMSNNPDEIYGLQAEFLQIGLKFGYPLFVGCWWQRSSHVRSKFSELGLPVAELEASGKLTIGDLSAAYIANGPQGPIDVWRQQALAGPGETIWGTGSHRLADWDGRYEDLIFFESELHRAFHRLPVIALCPCLLDPVEQPAFESLLTLAAHHSGALFISNGEPVLMKTAN